MDIGLLPQLLLRRLSSNELLQQHWNVLLSCALVLLAMVSVPQAWLDALPHVCLVQETIGVVCPGCGIIRSIYALTALNISASLSYNPCGLLLVVLLLLQIAMRLYAVSNPSFSTPIQQLSNKLSGLFLVALLGVWIFRIIEFII